MKLTDVSKMPFGKYKGKPMSEVPASYLFWLWTNGKESEKDEVAEYIRENMHNLEMEYPDGIWKK